MVRIPGTSRSQSVTPSVTQYATLFVGLSFGTPNTPQTECVTLILTQYATGMARRSPRIPNTPRSKSVNRDRAGALFSDVSRCFGGSPATPPPNPFRHTEIPLWG